MEREVFACFSKNASIRKESSSGGIYALLAEDVLQKGGKVFAVCYDDHLETVHVEISTHDELEKSYGSKYVPSRLGDTFARVKKCLTGGQLVLFVGTPCQCSGLLAFLQKRYDNLITVDFVCHGVPSRVAWRKYLEGLSFRNKIVAINMRDKSSGWSGRKYSWCFTLSDGKRKVIPNWLISYMTGFTSDFYLRPSCYECRFKGIDRPTDITLADYWGVWDIQPEMDDNNGTSLVIVHSIKGRELFNDLSDKIERKPADIAQAVENNESMISSAAYTEKREEFFRMLASGKKFDRIIDDLRQVSTVNRIKRNMKEALRGFKGQ